MIFTIPLWWATRLQAALTRQTLEASHRPYVTEVLGPTESGTLGRLSFTVALENPGTVPAQIAAWQVRGTVETIRRMPGGQHD